MCYYLFIFTCTCFIWLLIINAEFSTRNSFFGTMKLMFLELEQIQTLKKKQPTTQTSSQDSYNRKETWLLSMKDNYHYILVSFLGTGVVFLALRKNCVIRCRFRVNINIRIILLSWNLLKLYKYLLHPYFWTRFEILQKHYNSTFF